MCSLCGSQSHWNHLRNCKKKSRCVSSSSGESCLTGLGCGLGIGILKSSLSDSDLQLKLGIKDVCAGQSFWMTKGVCTLGASVSGWVDQFNRTLVRSDVLGWETKEYVVDHTAETGLGRQDQCQAPVFWYKELLIPDLQCLTPTLVMIWVADHKYPCSWLGTTENYRTRASYLPVECWPPGTFKNKSVFVTEWPADVTHSLVIWSVLYEAQYLKWLLPIGNQSFVSGERH